MKPKSSFDADFAPNGPVHSSRWVIAGRIFAVALAGLAWQLRAETRSAPVASSVPKLIASGPRARPAPRRTWQPATQPSPRDPFVLVADPSIDPRMVVQAPAEMDQKMVIDPQNQLRQEIFISPQAGNGRKP